MAQWLPIVIQLIISNCTSHQRLRRRTVIIRWRVTGGADLCATTASKRHTRLVLSEAIGDAGYDGKGTDNKYKYVAMDEKLHVEIDWPSNKTPFES